MVNLRFPLNAAINLFSNSVTLKTKTVTIDKYGDESYDSTSSTVIAAVNDISGDEDWNMEGVFVPGDKIFFFKGSQSGIETGNIVELNDIEYEISKEPIKHIISNLTQAIEARSKRINI